ncbi:MAG: putative glycosyltransferase EpsE [Chloroflexi bacterium ADurb.Bin360]|nr:MAG: putative glycosyltransferase EpsE [Chloroflexi bacterium ADurb.Bin360]
MIDFSREVRERFLLQQEYLGTTKAVNHTKPLVSVSVATYQHVHFIEQCLDDILAQETDFPYEIIVGEDGSVDGTRDICIKYAINHPDKIRLFLRDRNTTTLMHENRQIRFNGVFCRMSCRGKYIALCEGDDYWTDPHKLQKQVEFLEAHPECSMCFHEAYDLWPDGSKKLFVRARASEIKPLYTLDDVVIRYFIPTASMVFRKTAVEDLPREFYQAPGGDWFLHVILSQSGYLGYIDEPWSVYRWHTGGVMSYAPQTAQLRHTMDTAFFINQYLDDNYSHLLRPFIVKHLIELVVLEAAGAITNNKNLSVRETIQQKVESCSHHLALSLKEVDIIASAVTQRLVYVFYGMDDLATVRNCWLASLRWPAYLPWRNRGFWSIGLTALLGQKHSNQIRAAIRMLESNHSR